MKKKELKTFGNLVNQGSFLFFNFIERGDYPKQEIWLM